MTSSALVNGFAMNFNLGPLDETLEPPIDNYVPFNVIFAVLDPPTCQAKLESGML